MDVVWNKNIPQNLVRQMNNFTLGINHYAHEPAEKIEGKAEPLLTSTLETRDTARGRAAGHLIVSRKYLI